MKHYLVKVRTASDAFCYSAIGTSSWEVFDAALDAFGACAISVRPQ